MKIDEMPSWYRVKVSLGAASRPQGRQRPFDIGPLNSMEITKISRNFRKSMKIDETSWDRVKLSLGAASRPERAAQAASLGPLKCMEIYKIA